MSGVSFIIGSGNRLAYHSSDLLFDLAVWAPSAAVPQRMGERALQVGERLRPLAVPHALGNTRIHMTLQQLNRHRVERLLNGTQLDEQILTRLMLAQKPVNPAHLTLDPLQPMADSALDFGLQVGLGATIHDDPFVASFRNRELTEYIPMGV